MRFVTLGKHPGTIMFGRLLVFKSSTRKMLVNRYCSMSYMQNYLQLPISSSSLSLQPHEFHAARIEFHRASYFPTISAFRYTLAECHVIVCTVISPAIVLPLSVVWLWVQQVFYTKFRRIFLSPVSCDMCLCVFCLCLHEKAAQQPLCKAKPEQKTIEFTIEICMVHATSLSLRQLAYT